MQPPNSPDLKPVDYTIRGALRKTVYHQQSFASVDELIRAIIDARQKLPQSPINKSVSHMDSTMRMADTSNTCSVDMQNVRMLTLCSCFLVVSVIYSVVVEEHKQLPHVT